MLSACNCAGVWKMDFKLASFCIGVKVDEGMLRDDFAERICYVNHDKCLFIPKYLYFQYSGMDLENLKNGVARGVHKALKKYNLNYPDCLKLDTLCDTLSKKNDQSTHKTDNLDTLSDTPSIPYGIGDRDIDIDRVLIVSSIHIYKVGSIIPSKLSKTYYFKIWFSNSFSKLRKTLASYSFIKSYSNIYC